MLLTPAVPTRRTLAALALAAGAAALLASVARAADGVVEIGAAGAAQGNVTPGDAAGLPITLSQPGSYRLTSDLVQLSSSVDVILVTADDVTIDFAGHVVRGPVTCSGDPVTSCASAGTGAAVSASPRSQVHVKNGSVRGTGRGLALGPRCYVESMRVRGTSGVGVECTGASGIVRDTLVSGTGAAGIVIDRGVVVRSASEGNQLDGVQAGNSVVSDVTAHHNGGAGVTQTTAAVLLAGDRLLANGAAGARTGVSGLVLGSRSVGNGFGFSLGDGSLLRRSVVRASSGSGGVQALRGSALTQSVSGGNTGAAAFVDLGLVAENVWRGNATPGTVRSPSLVTESAITGNPGASLSVLLTSPTGQGRNVLVGNGAAEPQWSGNAVSIDTSVCGSDTTCP